MSKKNLLFIITDQQRFDTMACYGNRALHTPGFDRLSQNSYVFENAYCTTPICTPSRASFLTGQWPHEHQCIANNTPLSSNIATIAELLDDDYYCAYYGKWHLGDELVPTHGFQERVSTEDAPYRPYFSNPEYLDLRSDYHHFLVANGFAPDTVADDGARVFSREYEASLAEPYTKPTFLADRASSFIEAYSRENPFFLAVSFLEPHNPFWGPLNNLYDPDSLNVGPTFARSKEAPVSHKEALMAKDFATHGIDGFSLQSEWDWRRVRANYYGLVSLIDHAVEQILVSLDRAGLAEDTLVVFTSDHGEMMGDHALMTKGLRYEQSVKVPLLMRVPGLSTEETRVPGNFSHIDLVPTLLDLLDQHPGDHLQGESKATVLRGETDLSDNDVVITWYGDADTSYWDQIPGDFTQSARELAAFSQWRTIISPDRWKLTLSPDDICELFDLNADPDELVNLFESPDQRERIIELTNRIQLWQKRTKDTLGLSSVDHRE